MFRHGCSTVLSACVYYTYILKKKVETQQAELPILVVGGGVMGSSIASSIASRGSKVILIDESHIMRSSWGDTRGLQNGYTGVYGKLVRRSKALWEQLQAYDDTYKEDHGRGQLFWNASNMLILSTSADAEEAKVTHIRAGFRKEKTQIMDNCKVHESYPALVLENGETGFVDNDCLVLSAVDCIFALQDKAERNGAIIHLNEKVENINVETCEVRTNAGRTVQYSKMVLATGPWTNRSLSAAKLETLPILVSAEQLLYIAPRKNSDRSSMCLPWETYSIGKMPIIDGEINVTDDAASLRGFVYACPMVPGGKHAFKCAVHMMGEFMHTSDFHVKPGSSPLEYTDPTVYHRKTLRCHQPEADEVDQYQKQIVTKFVSKHLPTLDVEEISMVFRCFYTSASDNDFIIGYHPQAPENVVVVTGFHGEGFKFAPVIGESIADLVLARHDAQMPALTKELLDLCKPARFFPNKKQ